MAASNFTSILIWWLFSIQLAVSQLPLLAYIVSPRLLGECLTLAISHLGNTANPDTNGLVPRSLVTIAMARDQTSIFYTTEVPPVQIMRGVVTCQSSAAYVSRYNTISVLVDYTCRGIACEQQPNDIKTVRYVHLFSFVCDGEYTTWDYVPGYSIYVNRTTTNLISSPIITREGSCSLCSNDPTFIDTPRYDPVTACVACKPECYRVGLGWCTTNIGGSDVQASCCSYWYRPPRQSIISCVQNCLAPYARIDHRAVFCYLEAAIGRVGRSSGFTDVFCDGDELNLNCSTPYAVFHLAWDVTIPGQNPERSQITYNAGSLLNRPTHLDNGATSILYRFAESELSLPVTGGILVNGVTVECSINLLMSTSIEIQRASLEEVPSAPSGIVVSQQYSHINPFLTIVTLQWNRSSSSQSMAQWYELQFLPQPPSPIYAKQSAPFVTLPLQFDVEYAAVLKAVNCIGSSPSISMSIHLAPPTVISVFSTSPHILLYYKVGLPLGYTGAALTCLAFGFPEPPIVNWLKITNTGRQTMLSSNSLHGGDPRFVSAQLIFQNGFTRNDEADYVCSTQSSNTNSTVFGIRQGQQSRAPALCSFNSTLVFFQIRVIDTSCRGWDENLKQRVASQFLRLLKGLSLLPTSSSNIVLTQDPVCSNNVENAVLFRGVITDIRVQPTREIYCGLKSWHELGPTILINDSLHHVDRGCVFRIPSQYEPECPGFSAPASMISTAIGGSMAGILLVGTVAVFGVALVVVRTRKTTKLTPKHTRDYRGVRGSSVYRGSMYEDNDDLSYYSVGATTVYRDAATARSDGATTVYRDDATTVYGDDATTMYTGEGTTVYGDDATTVYTGEGTTLYGDDATTVYTGEGTTLYGDDATTVYTGEGTTVYDDDATTVYTKTTNDATTVYDDDATTVYTGYTTTDDATTVYSGYTTTDGATSVYTGDATTVYNEGCDYDNITTKSYSSHKKKKKKRRRHH